MKVLVCGGRDFQDQKKVYEYLDFLNEEYLIECIITGNAKGADTLANNWAKARKIDLVTYPADWKKYGKRAGVIRNVHMLEETKPDMVVAFPGGRGTAHMVWIARQANVLVCDLGEDG